jgi:flavin-binding protein dodecin
VTAKRTRAAAPAGTCVTAGPFADSRGLADAQDAAARTKNRDATKNRGVRGILPGSTPETDIMSGVAKVTEIIASSKKSFEDAIERGIARASKTLKGVQGAWVENLKVTVSNGKVVEYRVNMKVTFVLKD